jgi:hypothetical protein
LSRNFLPFRSTWVHPGFLVGSCFSIFSFICMFCKFLFVLLFFFIWPLCCLFFDLRILITPLVSSNSSRNRLRHSRLIIFSIYSIKQIFKTESKNIFFDNNYMYIIILYIVIEWIKQRLWFLLWYLQTYFSP